MNTLTEAIQSLKISEKSCREEASGELDNVNRPDGMTAIGAEIAEVRRFLCQLNRRKPSLSKYATVKKEP